MGDTFPSEDQSWRTSALSCSSFPPGITFATWVSSYSQQHCQWKRLESLSTRPRERERERLLWSDAEDVCGLILADPWEGEVSSAKVRGLGGIHVRTIHGRCSSRWQMSPGIPPGTALLLEGRRHPLTRDSAVSVTRGREPNLIPSHPCSRRPWRPFNYWRDRARVSWSRII